MKSFSRGAVPFAAGLLAAALALAAACSEQPTGRGDDFVGELTLEYTGVADLPAGGFSARGATPFDARNQPIPGNWAYSIDVAPQRIEALQPMGSTYTRVLINIPRVVRSDTAFVFRLACRPETERCATAVMSFGVGPSGGTPDFACSFFGGEIAITGRDAENLRGRFQASAECTSPGGGDEGNIQVRNGSFDVPLIFFDDP